MSQPVPSSAGEFRLDIDLANAAITKLEEVRDRLSTLREDAAVLAKSTDETAHDLISREAFELLRRKADGEPGSLGIALAQGIEHVDALLKQMRADVAQQIDIDSSAARGIART